MKTRLEELQKDRETGDAFIGCIIFVSMLCLVGSFVLFAFSCYVPAFYLLALAHVLRQGVRE